MKISTVTGTVFFCLLALALNVVNAQQKSIEASVDSVLKLMTLKRKWDREPIQRRLGGDRPDHQAGDKQHQIKKGMLGFDAERYRL